MLKYREKQMSQARTALGRSRDDWMSLTDRFNHRKEWLDVISHTNHATDDEHSGYVDNFVNEPQA